MRVWLYQQARKWVPRIPLGVSYRLAEIGGDMMWLFARGARANIEHNQKRALGPEATEREIALSSRKVLHYLAKIYVDEFRLPAMNGQELMDVVTVHGLDHLNAAREKGKGVILTSAHYGAPHVVGHLLAILGYPTTVVVEHIQPEELFEFMCEMRQTHGTRLIAVDKPLIGLIRTLRKENGVVGLVSDRNPSGTGFDMDFLGEETRVADGPAQLALRTGAPIVVAFCRRTDDNRFEAFVEPPIYLPDGVDDIEAAARAGTRKVMERFEQFIREKPEQWVMTVPLWSGNSNGATGSTG